MRVREFVVNVRQILAGLPKNTSAKDALVHSESVASLDELEVLCWLCADSDELVNNWELSPFITFLQERSDRLSKELPHAHYTAEEVTNANFVCVELAKVLSSCLHTDAQRKRPLVFLLPHLQVDAATAIQFLQCPQNFALNEDASELTKLNYSKTTVHSIPSALEGQDLDKLTATLSQLPYGHRREYLNTFPLHIVSALLLKGKHFRVAVNEQAYYVGDEEHARNVLMTFGYYYHELTRTRTHDYKHLSGSLSGYEKNIKLKGINLVLTFLESGENLAKFAEYLDSDVFKEKVSSSLVSSKEYTLKDVVLQGELGDFCKMITFASEPKNREPVQPTRWFGRS